MSKLTHIKSEVWPAVLLTITLLGFQMIYFLQNNAGFGIPIYWVWGYLAFTFNKFEYQKRLLWYIYVISLLHLIGGLEPTAEQNFYYFYFIEINEHLFRYDQLVHLISGVLVTLILWDSFFHKIQPRSYFVWILLMLSSMGAATMHEISEFVFSISSPDDGVGGYINNLTDLTMHFIASLITMAYLYWKVKSSNESA